MSTIGNRIRAQRIKLGLSVDDLADKLGKNRATIYRYESDEIENFPVTIIKPLATILRVSPAYLMGWADKEDGSDIYSTNTTYEAAVSVNSSAANNEFPLSAHEKTVVIAYRSKPEMQPAVDKLLGIDTEVSTEIIKIAARDGSFTETTITSDDIENINNLPDVDDI